MWLCKGKKLFILTTYDFCLCTNPNSKTWINIICDLQLLTWWHKSLMDPTTIIVCEIGSAHHGATYCKVELYIRDTVNTLMPLTCLATTCPRLLFLFLFWWFSKNVRWSKMKWLMTSRTISLGMEMVEKSKDSIHMVGSCIHTCGVKETTLHDIYLKYIYGTIKSEVEWNWSLMFSLRLMYIV